MGWVKSVNVAVVRTGSWAGRWGESGIDKRPISEPARFDEAGVVGDSVIDTDSHGAWYQAAYAFDLEELQHWSTKLSKDLVPGNAGENLTLVRCDASSAVIGERWRVGSAVLRVTGPRNPCRVFAGFWDLPRLVKRFTEHGRPGAYLAVEQAGAITAGDSVEVLTRPDHAVTVSDVFAFRMQRRVELAEHVRHGLADLPPRWREQVASALDASLGSGDVIQS